MTCPCMLGRRSRGPSKRYTASELKRKPTLSTGQCDSLKVDTGMKRVWISRCTVADGEPFNNKVTVEKLHDGRWETVEEYRG